MRTKEEFMKMVEIANRADKMGLMVFDRMSLIMDLECVHENMGLRLDDLLNADDMNFGHDIVGIQDKLDRTTKKFHDCFVPRFAGEVM